MTQLPSFRVLIASLSVLMLCMTIIPVQADAGFTDNFFLLGEWICDDHQSAGVDTFTYNFETGGKGTFTVTFADETKESNTTPFQWAIVGDQLNLLFENILDWEKNDYELSEMNRNLEINSDGKVFEKTGSICGVCCPFWFSAIGISAFAGIVMVRGICSRRN